MTAQTAVTAHEQSCRAGWKYLQGSQRETSKKTNWMKGKKGHKEKAFTRFLDMSSEANVLSDAGMWLFMLSIEYYSF